MRNRTWSNVILAAMIALCVSTVAKPEAAPAVSVAQAIQTTATPPAGVANVAHGYAIAVLLSDELPTIEPSATLSESVVSVEAAADRAMADAASAAGDAASGIEMPFFSFGGGASSE